METKGSFSPENAIFVIKTLSDLPLVNFIYSGDLVYVKNLETIIKDLQSNKYINEQQFSRDVLDSFSSIIDMYPSSEYPLLVVEYLGKKFKSYKKKYMPSTTNEWLKQCNTFKNQIKTYMFTKKKN